MRIVVTGAEGFVGRHVLDELSRHDVEVLAWHRPAVTPPQETDPAVRWQAVDLLDYEALPAALAGVSHVVHAARLTQPGHTAEVYEAANVTATTNLLDACAALSLDGFLYLSSAAMYGDGLPPWPVDESWAFRPRGAAERSRVMAEQAARTYRRRVPLTVLRPALSLGPGARGVLWHVLTHLLAHRRAALVAGGRAPVSVVSGTDLARAVWAILDQPASAEGSVYHVAGVATDWRSIALEACRIAQRRPRYRSLPLWSAVAARRVGAEWLVGVPSQFPRYVDWMGRPHLIDDTRLRVTVGYEPLLGLGAALRSTVEWISATGGAGAARGDA